MQIIYYSEIFMLFNLLLNQQNYNQKLSAAGEAFLCLFILMTLWNRDFWRGFSFQLKLKELLLFKYNFTAIFKKKQVIELIPELPKSDELPSFDDMAKLLIKGLPASDRSEAYTLLVTQLLPQKWDRRPTFLERREQVEVIYQSLADALQQAPPNQRLKVLRADLCESEIRQIFLDSFMLAIARYMLEHPDATPKTPMSWLDLQEDSKFSAMPTTEIEYKALELLEEVEKWDKFAKAKHPDIWEQYKLKPFNAQLNLNSAYSGSFHAAMGDFAIFLRSVGASFNEINLH